MSQKGIFLKNWFFGVFLLVVFLLLDLSFARAAAPMVRFKMGVSNLTVNAGDLVLEEALNSMVTMQPSVLWAFPSFSSRLGVHYLQEVGGEFGATPVSGIGISGYYHIFGISTGYAVDGEGTITTRSRPGPYLYAGISPINFNLNRESEPTFYFSSFMYDISAGIGYDYPVTQNLVVSVEYLFRTGIGSSSDVANVDYEGSTLFLSIGTSYF